MKEFLKFIYRSSNQFRYSCFSVPHRSSAPYAGADLQSVPFARLQSVPTISFHLYLLCFTNSNTISRSLFKPA